jgi:hypothetical protein
LAKKTTNLYLRNLDIDGLGYLAFDLRFEIVPAHHTSMTVGRGGKNKLSLS